MSAHVNWMIIRNNSSFLLKTNGQTMSKEKNNLRGRNSFRFNGLIHDKSVGIEPAKDGKGVVMVLRKPRVKGQPSKMHRRIELKKDSRRVIRSIRNAVKHSRYRSDLGNTAVRRACAVLKSQKPVVVKSKSGRAKKD